MMAMPKPASARATSKDVGSLPFLSSHLALFVRLAFVSFGSQSLALTRFAYVALPYRRWRRGRWYCRLTPLTLLRPDSERVSPVSLLPSALRGVAGCLRGGVGVWASLLAFDFA